MSIKCIKTGATCYVDPWNAWIHGDAFETRDETVFLKWNGELIKDRVPHRHHYVFSTWEAHWGKGANEQVLVCNKGHYWKGSWEGTHTVTAAEFYSLKTTMDELMGRRYRFYVTDNLDVELLEKQIADGKSVDLSFGKFLGGI
jgi:hypothetical protein